MAVVELSLLAARLVARAGHDVGAGMASVGQHIFANKP